MSAHAWMDVVSVLIFKNSCRSFPLSLSLSLCVCLSDGCRLVFILTVNYQMLTEWYAWDSVSLVFEKTMICIKINHKDMESSGFMVFIQKT